MALLKVLEYPHKKLRERSRTVENFGADLHNFLAAMGETMLFKKGIGLAAIQVGRPWRALVINLPREDEKQYPEDCLEIINPVITAHAGATVHNEGCLSVPDFYEDVPRFAQICVAYCDRYGAAQNLQATGLLAVAIQHEMDHLEGILFIDKLSLVKRKKFEKEWKQESKKIKKPPNPKDKK